MELVEQLTGVLSKSYTDFVDDLLGEDIVFALYNSEDMKTGQMKAVEK